MAKFASIQAAPTQVPTYEGGVGFHKDARTELYTLAINEFVSEPTYYEAAGTRMQRLRELTAELAQLDPQWLARFVVWLRTEANIRSAAIVVAAEYAASRASLPRPREVIASVCRRADEPAELLAYWLDVHGRSVPMPVKRGIADAATRLYSEEAVLKYDSSRRGLRMGDVIELCHPAPRSSQQSALFRHILDRRHGRFRNSAEQREALRRVGLHRLVSAYTLDVVPPEERREALDHHGRRLADAGYTWERLAGWLPGGMDARAWEQIIPTMGYMALLRNLRNFEQAGVSDPILAQVALRLAHPDEVLRSGQFPYRFWSAYKNLDTNYFTPTLERALQTSVENVPALGGRTLVALDTSASMVVPVASRSKVMRVEVGALFAASLASRSRSDVIIYADKGRLVTDLPQSVLRATQRIESLVGEVGNGTRTWRSILPHYRGQDRIVVFTDAADHPGQVPALPDVPIYVWDLSGYRVVNVDPDQPKRFVFGGFSDASFRLIPLLEAGIETSWPWERAPISA